MIERLEKLHELLKEIISDSYGDQYGIADLPNFEKAMDRLSNESAFYQRTINEIKTLKESCQ